MLSWNARSTGRLAKMTSSHTQIFDPHTQNERHKTVFSLFAILVQTFNKWKMTKKRQLLTATFAYSHICLQPYLHSAIFAYICMQPHLHTLFVSIWPHKRWVRGYKLEGMDILMTLGKTGGITNEHPDQHLEAKGWLLWQAGQNQPLSLS